MPSDRVQQVLDIIKEMTILELRDLNKQIEEVFGVTAAAPMMMAAGAAPAGAAAAAEPVEEQTEFSVVLTSFGENKNQRDQGGSRSDVPGTQGGQRPG